MAFLKEKELGDAYQSAKKTAEEWHRPYDEYERLESNQPSAALPENYPRVTDGTLSSLHAEKPMRIWGQLQTGRVVQLPTDAQDFEDWKLEMLNIFWTNRIVKNANSQAPFFTKLRTGLGKAGTYGSQPFFSFPVSTPYYTGADFILPKIRDVLLEPGKVSDTDSDYIWMNRHYTKLQLRQIISHAGKIKGHAGWDMKALKKIYDGNSFNTQDDDTQHSEERGKVDHSKVVTFSTCFSRGYNAPFTTICGKGTDMQVVRRQKNTNLTGDIPVTFLYAEQNLVNPYGVSQIERAGPTQNMLDFMVAAHAFATQQALDPPIKIAGNVAQDENFDVDSIVMESGQHWYTGGVTVDSVDLTNGIHAQFPSAMSMYKTNIMNQQGTTDATVSGTFSGNPMYSKTPTGIKQQQERTNARDNALRQNTDAFMSVLARNLINITLQNVEGSEAIKITNDQREKLRAKGADIPETDEEIIAEFDELKAGEFDFDIEAGSSVIKDDSETKDRILETIKTLTEIPDIEAKLAEEGKELKIGELIQSYLGTTGLENYEKVLVELSPEKQAAMQAMKGESMNQPEQLAQPEQPMPMEAAEGSIEAQPAVLSQEPSVGEGDVDAMLAEQEERVKMIEALKEKGWSDEDIIKYMQREEGVSDE